MPVILCETADDSLAFPQSDARRMIVGTKFLILANSYEALSLSCSMNILHQYKGPRANSENNAICRGP